MKFMNRSIRICLFLSLIIVGLNVSGQDRVVWNKDKINSKNADTVALGDYLPIKDGKVYYEVIVEQKGAKQSELFTKAAVVTQGIRPENALVSADFDQQMGVCNIHMVFMISQTTLLSVLGSNPTTKTYFFNTIATIIAKDDKFKIKIEVPDYNFESLSKFSSYADQAKTKGIPIQELANSKSAFKKQRINALTRLNELMLENFNKLYLGMKKQEDTNF